MGSCSGGQLTVNVEWASGGGATEEVWSLDGKR